MMLCCTFTLPDRTLYHFKHPSDKYYYVYCLTMQKKYERNEAFSYDDFCFCGRQISRRFLINVPKNNCASFFSFEHLPNKLHCSLE